LVIHTLFYSSHWFPTRRFICPPDDESWLCLFINKKQGTGFELLLQNNFMINRKEKKSENPQVNFSRSKEIAYWTKKYNVSPEYFQQLFKEAGYSISRLMTLMPATAAGR